MEFQEYQKRAVETAVYSDEWRLIYPVMGLANEAGEVLGKVKKVMRDDGGEVTLERREEILAEIGDLLWYVAVTCSDLDASLSDVAAQNLAKLADRKARNVIQGSGDTR
jgi:NTP pyrophosphatase (non-canonical NTP hydrolase)